MHQMCGQVRFPARDSRLSAIQRIEGDRPLLSKSNLARPAGYTTEDLLQMSASGCSIFAVVYEIRRRGLRPASVSPGRDRRHLLQRVYNRRFAANEHAELQQICGCIPIPARNARRGRGGTQQGQAATPVPSSERAQPSAANGNRLAPGGSAAASAHTILHDRQRAACGTAGTGVSRFRRCKIYIHERTEDAVGGRPSPRSRRRTGGKEENGTVGPAPSQRQPIPVRG